MRHAVKFRRKEWSSGVHQFGFMIPTAAPTGRREPVGDEATITPRRANHILVCKDSEEATATALTANMKTDRAKINVSQLWVYKAKPPHLMRLSGRHMPGQIA